MKKTDKKVEVRNGTQTFTRCVYVNEFGTEHFKYEGKFHHIFWSDYFKRYTAPYFGEVKYI